MIRDACREAGVPEPTVEFDGGVRQWQVPDEVKQTVVPPTTEVTTEVERLVATLSGEMTRRELQNALGLKNDEHFRKAYLLPALEAGVIEMTIPDKPNSPLAEVSAHVCKQSSAHSEDRGDDDMRSVVSFEVALLGFYQAHAVREPAVREARTEFCTRLVQNVRVPDAQVTRSHRTRTRRGRS